jgi:hypothetical protein
LIYGNPDTVPTTPACSVARHVAGRNAELAARNECQNATIDVLKMMSASPVTRSQSSI